MPGKDIDEPDPAIGNAGVPQVKTFNARPAKQDLKKFAARVRNRPFHVVTKNLRISAQNPK